MASGPQNELAPNCPLKQRSSSALVDSLNLADSKGKETDKMTPNGRRRLPKLIRCTSTPVSALNLDLLHEFRTPYQVPLAVRNKAPPKQINWTLDSTGEDSGIHSNFESSISPSESDISKSFDQSTDISLGAISKRGPLRRSPRLTSLKGCATPKTSLLRDIYSPHVQAKSPCQIEVDKHFRRSLTLPGLYIDREYVDIVRYLYDTGMFHILKLIWSFLPEPDLVKCSLVSVSWNKSIKAEQETCRRKDDYVAKLKLDSENHPAESRSHRLTPRKALANVLNLPKSPNSSKRERQNSANAVVSPSKYRHKLFTEEASKLGPGESLQPCPRCTSPSRVIPLENRATCSRLSCGFDFCMDCRCDSHTGSPCRSSRGLKCKGKILGKKSRDRLRRL